MTDWTIILRSMRARLFSTVTTIVTVAVAVALMLVLLTMRDAGRKAFERGGGNMHLLLSRDASPLVSVLNAVFFANAPRAPITYKEYEQFVKATPQVSPLIDWAVPIQLGDSYKARWPVVAASDEVFTKYTPGDAPWSFAAGRPFADDFEVVLGSATARESGLKLGDRIILTHGFPTRGAAAEDPHEHGEYRYSVVGILEPTGLAFDRAIFTSLMSTWIIHAHDRIAAERRRAASGDDEATPSSPDTDTVPDSHSHSHGTGPLANSNNVTDADKKITNIFVRVRSREGSDATASLPVLFDRLRRGQGFPGGITVAQPRQEMTRLLDIVGNVDRILVAIAGVVMVSSGIAIMLALYNSMEQRRRQIAVLRVLGASQSRVLGLVLTESAVIGLLGAALGIILAAVGAALAASIMKDRLGLVIDSKLEPVPTILVVIATIALASLAGLVPAIAAYKTSVMRNLRPLG